MAEQRDIIKRLCDRAAFNTCVPPERLMAEAAAEIERLRHLVKSWEEGTRIAALDAERIPKQD